MENILSDIFHKVGSDTQLLQVNFGKKALKDVAESEQNCLRAIFIQHLECTPWEVLLEFIPEFAKIFLSWLSDWLQCLPNHFHLNFLFLDFFPYQLFDVFQFPIMSDNSDLPTILKLRIQVEELVKDFLPFELFTQGFK